MSQESKSLKELGIEYKLAPGDNGAIYVFESRYPEFGFKTTGGFGDCLQLYQGIINLNTNESKGLYEIKKGFNSVPLFVENPKGLAEILENEPEKFEGVNAILDLSNFVVGRRNNFAMLQLYQIDKKNN